MEDRAGVEVEARSPKGGQVLGIVTASRSVNAMQQRRS